MGTIKFKGNDEITVEQETLQNTEEELQDEAIRECNVNLPKEALFEKTNKVGAHQNVFRYNDGTARQVISGFPKNYMEKQDNQYKKIETCVCKNTDGNLECCKNTFETKFYGKADNGKVYSIEKNNCGVTLFAKDAVASTVTVERSENADNKVLLKNVQAGVDIEYEVEPNRIKENIVVKERQNSYIFDFDIDLTNLNIGVSEDNKSLELKNKETGEIEFRIPGPFMYDANHDESDMVSYEIQENNGTISIRVVAEPEYFNDPNRAFPVIIDPQVIVNDDAITSHQVYYKLRGSSGYVYNWNSESSSYIKVIRNSSRDYKTNLFIDKSRIGLLDSTISSVKLKLKRYSVSDTGSILVNGSSVYMGNSDFVVDITNTFKSYSDTAQLTVTIEPYSDYVNGLFYASGVNAPELEIAYLGNNDKPAIKTYSIAGVGQGAFNVGTGELVTSFGTVSTSDFSIDCGIKHIYKQTDTKYGLGDNFRLNLHESFVKNSATCDYTDANGTKQLFTEHYYYVDDANNRQIVSKSIVEVGPDGQMTCSVGGKVFDVQVEYRSSTGLKAMPKLEGIRKAELLEQRSDEFKQLEQQVEGYQNVLNDYVMINTNTHAISYDYPITESKYNALANASYCCLVLPKAEALQYKSLIKQLENLDSTVEHDDIIQDKSDINSNVIAIKSSLQQLLQELNYYQVVRNIEGFGTNVDSAYMIDDVKFSVLGDNTLYYSDKPSKSVNSTITIDDDEKETSSSSTTDSNIYTLGKDLKLMLYQRNLLVHQMNEAGSNVDSQRKLVNSQVGLITGRRERYIKQFKDYYKEYVNLKFKYEFARKHMPVHFLTDGKLFKGFNEYGDLVAIYDSFNNAVTIEYDDSLSGTKRIKRVFDGEARTVLFDYNSDNRLTSVTDARGRITRYEYDSLNRVSKIMYPNGESITVTYTTTNNKYEIYEVVSSDKLKTRLNYSYGKLISIYDYSQIGRIKHGETTSSSDLPLGNNTISYTEVTTTITDQDNNKVKYLFNNDEKVVGEIVEEGGKVVSAEMVDYVPYAKNNVQHAKKDTLNTTPLNSYNFVAGDTENTTLNAFNNPQQTVTNARNLNDSGTITQTATVDYFYNEDQKVTTEKNTLAITGEKSIVGYKKYYYNANGEIVRTESYVEDEELTNGIAIEETFYDDKGNQIKSVSYNSLDTASKFYTEREIAENGQTLAEFDETGQNKTRLGYIDGTNIVANETLPNGSKFTYGRDVDDTVTAITQSTEDCEENSTQTHHTCGVVTELKSGNNVVNYEYDHKRRITKVGLNGNSDYVENRYADGAGTANDKVSAISTPRVNDGNKKSDIFVAETNRKGQIVSVKYGYENKLKADGTYKDVSEYTLTPLIANTYDSKNRLSGFTDNVDGAYSYEYDSLDRMIKFKKGTTQLENCTYDNHGNLSAKTITNDGVNRTYGYNYEADSTKKLASISVNGLTISPKYDILNRKSEKVVSANPGKILGEYYYYSKYGDHATNRISTIRYGNKTGSDYAIGDNLKYVYDSMSNISKVYENGLLQVSYTYDNLNRLVREDNKKRNKTYLIAYDNNGNIISKSECSYTVKPLEELEELSTFHYSYADNSDRLLNYNGESFVYDEIGNPTIYRGKSAAWTKGRQLTNYNGTAFTYNGHGQRTGKGSTMFTYDSAGNLIKQSNGLEYLYDERGVFGFVYDGATYLYRKNAQGDIIAILNTAGTKVGAYTYDAWGNQSITLDTNGIATLNPIRYRGYYFDTETNLYYLQSRYYDPEIGRFITIDSMRYANSRTINGLNVYSYCGNNPVMRIDPKGTDWWNPFSWDWGAIGRAIGGIAMGIWGAAFTIATLPLALVIPGGGYLTQLGFSMSMYGGFMVASVFDSQVRTDMEAIGWNPFNSDESAVLNSSKVSFYKGMPVFRTPAGGRSGSFLGIFLTGDERNNSEGRNTVRHEWGHSVQQGIMGPAKYGLMIGIPSSLEWSNRDYYERPWEITADLFGGAKRNHSSADITRGRWYLAVSALFGVFGYFFLIGEYQ